MAYIYRCSRCRTRNSFKQPLEDYRRAKKCRACGYTKFYWDKERNRKADFCTCNGYHFNHRRGSKFCWANPQYEWNVRVLRYKEDPLQVSADIAFDAEPVLETSEEVPF
jgi:DNA-directed RNA polymerase subunit RPC12/RpoP